MGAHLWNMYYLQFLQAETALLPFVVFQSILFQVEEGSWNHAMLLKERWSQWLRFWAHFGKCNSNDSLLRSTKFSMLHLHTFPSSLSCCFPKRRVLAGYSLNNCLPMNNSSCARNNMGTSVSTMVKTNSKNKFITSNFQPSFIHLGVSFSGHLLHSPQKDHPPTNASAKRPTKVWWWNCSPHLS